MDYRTRQIQSVTLWGAVCNLALSAIKLAAGLLGRSSAMVADAVHSLSDLVSDVVVLVFAHISAKGKDKDHDYGHGKFETLATTVVSLLLLVVAARMIASSVGQIRSALGGTPPSPPGMIALVAAVVSIAVKEVLYQWTARVGRKLSSSVMVANAWHHRSDALSSVGSLVGIGGAILLGGRWTILDPLVGLAISVVIIVVAVRMSLPALAELTDASLPEDVEQRITEVIEAVPGVEDVHELKTRRCGHYSIAEVHMVVRPDMTIHEAHDITVEAERRLHAEFGDDMQLTIHVEPSVDSL